MANNSNNTITLSEIPTRAPESLDKKEARKISQARFRRIAELQNKLIAEEKHSVLIILQGMDGSGKDGATKNLFSQCTPANIQVYSFKKPTDEEFAHDFLWRVHMKTPAKGNIAIFNRSHYEDILIQRVHGWITEERVQKRMEAINAFEELLQFDNNTLILKFYLHISKDQQKEELQERIDEYDKHWKHNDNDWKEREHWNEYRKAYEYAINHSKVPWHIVAVDQRWYRDYVMSEIIVNELEKLNMQYPKLERE